MSGKGKEDQKTKEISVELSEATAERINSLDLQKRSIDNILEATLITVFEQEGHKVPMGSQMQFDLGSKKVSYFIPDGENIE